MIRIALILFLAALPLSGCVVERDTQPPRTATEQLLISTAADRAAKRLVLDLPHGTRIFVDTRNFTSADAKEADAKYAVAAIEDVLLHQGMALMPDPKQADVIVALRAGALSIDERKVLLGIPAMAIPIPFAGTVPTPEVALYGLDTEKGIAKFAAVGYGARDGRLRAASEAKAGFAKHAKKVILIVFGSTKTNFEPAALNKH